MKLVTYQAEKNNLRSGLYYDDRVIDLQKAASAMNLQLPATMIEFLEGGERMMELARKVIESMASGKLDEVGRIEASALAAPIPRPPSCRDGYAFRQHVATARRNRGVPMIEEFDQYPVFYFTNHNSIIGPGELVVQTDHLEKLDFELEAAIVIGRKGRNIKAEEADQYIAGYTIMNDFSARRLQMEEMKLNLGPAKGKDFATAIGPWLVTPDDLKDFCSSTPKGNHHDLRMTAYHNGELISDGNLKDMNWTFAEIIERASYGVDLYPGDVIGSGTVGTGCYLELNGSRTLAAKERGENYSPVWLQSGDTIEVRIDQLGSMTHKIVKADNSHSILALKKMAAVSV